MAGDRVTTEDGRQVEFRDSRRDVTPKVVTIRDMWRTVATVVGVLGLSMAGLFLWALDSRIDQRVSVHAQDPQAHISLVRVLDAQLANDKSKDAEIDRLTAQIDALQRDVRDLRETIVELKTVLRGERNERVQRR
jgi:hypothetical protein